VADRKEGGVVAEAKVAPPVEAEVATEAERGVRTPRWSELRA